MDTSGSPSLSEQLAAALDWWRDAGVDGVYADQPSALFDAASKAAPVPELAPEPARPAERAAPAAPPPPPPVEMLGGDRATWPQDWAAFTGWWQTESSLAAIGGGARIAPRGSTGADLLVLVPMPEAGDSDSLLSGQQGQLVAAFLRACGIAADCATIAAVLPGHTPVPDWQGLHAAGIGAIIKHMIMLAAPARVLVLGQDLLPLLDLEKRQTVRHMPLGESTMPLMASLAPDILLTTARGRIDLWRRWLEWTGTA